MMKCVRGPDPSTSLRLKSKFKMESGFFLIDFSHSTTPSAALRRKTPSETGG